MILLIFLTATWFVTKSLHFLYLFQVKEYRWDRTESYINEFGFGKMVYSLDVHLPARSARNIAVYSFSLWAFLILVLLSFEVPILYSAFTIGFFLAPLYAFFIVWFGVLLTSVPVALYRNWVIYKARQKMKTTKAKCIVITGSYAKTSVKELLYHIFQTKYHVAKTDENMNTNIGIALCILKNLEEQTEYFIVEVGAYRKGEIEQAIRYIPIHAVILTGLGNQHLDLYGSKEALIEEESSPVIMLEEGKTAYVNSSVPNLKTLKKQANAEVEQYGFNYQDSVSGKIHRSRHKKTTLDIQYKNQSYSLPVQYIGTHFYENLLPAVAVALDENIPFKAIRKAVSTLSPLEGKLSFHHGKYGSAILNDSQNSNLNGFLAAIDVANEIKKKRTIIVSQGIVELGEEKRSSYRKILKKMRRSQIQLWATDKDFRSQHRLVRIFNDVKSLKRKLSKELSPDTLIVIEGKFPQTFIKDFIKK